MPRLDLAVPFNEKDEAKQLGAKWDTGKKVWFVPEGTDHAPFAKWRPVDSSEPNYKADRYFIAEARVACWRCRKETAVFAVLLPAGHERIEVFDVDSSTLEFDSEEDYQKWLGSSESERVDWVKMDEPAFVQYVTHFDPVTVSHLQSLATRFRPDLSQTVGGSYWMNHCEHCNAKLGDHNLFHEIDSPFFPKTKQQAQAITLYPVARPIEVDCGDSSHEHHYIAFGEDSEALYGAQLIQFMRHT